MICKVWTTVTCKRLFGKSVINTYIKCILLNQLRSPLALVKHLFRNIWEGISQGYIRFYRKALFLSNFSKSGFKTETDIWDTNSKTFVNSIEVFNRLHDKRNWIAECNRKKVSFSHELRPMPKTLIKEILKDSQLV